MSKSDKVDSSQLPSTEKKPGGPDNWVEKHGVRQEAKLGGGVGLPSYIERIARHVQAKGFATGRAIAIAVSTVKKWASGSNHNGGNLKPGTVAKAAKAVAEWEGMRAKAHAASIAEAIRILDSGVLDASALDETLEGLATDLTYHLSLAEGVLMSLKGDGVAGKRGAVQSARTLLQEGRATLTLDRGAADKGELIEVRGMLRDEVQTLRGLLDGLGMPAPARLEENINGARGEPDVVARASALVKKRESIAKRAATHEQGLRNRDGKKEGAQGANGDFEGLHPRGAGGRWIKKGDGMQGQPDEQVKHLQRRLHHIGYNTGPADGRFGPNTESAVMEYQRLHKLQPDGVVGPKTTAALQKTDPSERDARLKGEANAQSYGAKYDPKTAAGRHARAVQNKALTGSPNLVKKPAAKGGAGKGGSKAGSKVGAGSKAASKAAGPKLTAASVLHKGVGVSGAPDPKVKQAQTMMQELGYDLGPAGVDGRFGPATEIAVRKLQRRYGLPGTGIMDKETLRLLNRAMQHASQPNKPGQFTIFADQEKLIGTPKGAQKLPKGKATPKPKPKPVATTAAKTDSKAAAKAYGKVTAARGKPVPATKKKALFAALHVNDASLLVWTPERALFDRLQGERERLQEALGTPEQTRVAARVRVLEEQVAQFDPGQHLRDRRGRFRDMVKAGENLEHQVVQQYQHGPHRVRMGPLKIGAIAGGHVGRQHVVGKFSGVAANGFRVTDDQGVEHVVPKGSLEVPTAVAHPPEVGDYMEFLQRARETVRFNHEHGIKMAGDGMRAPAVKPGLAGMSLPELRNEWARLDRDLLPFAGHPTDPTARKIIDRQKAVIKAQHHINKDNGSPSGIGQPGGPRDVVIIGAGPAGLSAGIYGGTEGLDTMMIDANEKPGGQARMSSRIENVIGFPSGITGRQLADMGMDQAERCGTDCSFGVHVTGLRYDEKTGLKHVSLSDGRTVTTRAVIIAGGVQFRHLDFPGSDSKDVVYGDSMAMKERAGKGDAVIVGGANSAGQAAIDTAASAGHVTLLIRSNIEKGMSKYLIDQLRSDPKVTILEGAEIKSANVKGGRVQSVSLKDGREVPASTVGLFIGSGPETDWAPVERDAHGFIAVHDGLETSMPGVFAAGDVRAGSIHRVITAAADGAAAISMTHGFLDSLKSRNLQESLEQAVAEIPNDMADDWLEACDKMDAYTGADTSPADLMESREIEVMERKLEEAVAARQAAAGSREQARLLAREQMLRGQLTALQEEWSDEARAAALASRRSHGGGRLGSLVKTMTGQHAGTPVAHNDPFAGHSKVRHPSYTADDVRKMDPQTADRHRHHASSHLEDLRWRMSMGDKDVTDDDIKHAEDFKRDITAAAGEAGHHPTGSFKEKSHPRAHVQEGLTYDRFGSLRLTPEDLELLAEAAEELLEAWDGKLHPRQRDGKFKDVPDYLKQATTLINITGMPSPKMGGVVAQRVASELAPDKKTPFAFSGDMSPEAIAKFSRPGMHSPAQAMQHEFPNNDAGNSHLLAVMSGAKSDKGLSAFAKPEAKTERFQIMRREARARGLSGIPDASDKLHAPPLPEGMHASALPGKNDEWVRNAKVGLLAPPVHSHFPGKNDEWLRNTKLGLLAPGFSIKPNAINVKQPGEEGFTEGMQHALGKVGDFSHFMVTKDYGDDRWDVEIVDDKGASHEFHINAGATLGGKPVDDSAVPKSHEAKKAELDIKADEMVAASDYRDGLDAESQGWFDYALGWAAHLEPGHQVSAAGPAVSTVIIRHEDGTYQAFHQPSDYPDSPLGQMRFSPDAAVMDAMPDVIGQQQMMDAENHPTGGSSDIVPQGGLVSNDAGVQIKDMVPGQHFAMKDGTEFELTDHDSGAFKIAKPVDGGKAKPFHKMHAPKSVGPKPETGKTDHTPSAEPAHVDLEGKLAASIEKAHGAKGGEAVVKGFHSTHTTHAGGGTHPHYEVDPSNPNLVSADQEGTLVGKTVLITGKIDGHTRAQMKAKAQAAGAHVIDSFPTHAGSLDLLIAGHDAGSKLAKATSHGVHILPASEALKLMECELDESWSFCFVDGPEVIEEALAQDE